MHWVAPPHRPRRGQGDVCHGDLVRAFDALGVSASTGATLSACGNAQVLVPDVLDDHALDQIAASSMAGLAGPAAPRRLWCGSAGLALALARRHGLTPDSASPPPAAVGPLLLATASRHPVLREQLRQLRATLPLHTPASLRPDVDAHCLAVDLSSITPQAPEAAAAALARHARELVERLAPPRMLVVIGGDTLLALCEAAGVRALVAEAGPRVGWGRATLLGGRWDGAVCLSRSGAFGTPDDLAVLLAMLLPARRGDIAPEPDCKGYTP